MELSGKRACQAEVSSRVREEAIVAGAEDRS